MVKQEERPRTRRSFIQTACSTSSSRSAYAVLGLETRLGVFLEEVSMKCLEEGA